MPIHRHDLTGCAPVPLAHYLKALGILRLVAEQKDPSARLWWEDEHAVLATTLDEDALLHFFADEYQPTPIVAPWNAGSGFYTGHDTEDAGDGDSDDDDSSEDDLTVAGAVNTIDRLLAVKGDRLAALQDAIRNARDNECNRFKETLSISREAKSRLNRDKADAVLKEASKNADAAKKALKDSIILDCLRTWRGPQLDWLMAGAIATGDPKHRVLYPQHLGGAGGANGKLDFTSNYAAAIREIAMTNQRDRVVTLLRSALKAGASRLDPRLTGGRSVGMFLPETVKAPNGSTGFSSERNANPWNLILLMEGTPLLRCGAGKRLESNSERHAMVPFSLDSAASASGGGSTVGETTASEQWMPLWNRPTSLWEVCALFTEGRSRVARRSCRKPSDMARAAGRLGVQRGLTELVRYSYPQRNGKSHLAVCLGRWRVEANPNGSVADRIVPWVESLSGALIKKGTPATWKSASRRCEEALMAVCRDGRDARRWEDLLLALGAAEATLARTPAKAAAAFLRPLSDLPGRWLELLPKAPELRFVELRLAAALANQYGLRGGRVNLGDSIRAHCLPFEWKRDRWNTTAFATAAGVETVADTGDFLRDAAAILRRRLRTDAGGAFALRAGRGFFAAPDDLARFLRGEADDNRIWALARALMALDWSEANTERSEAWLTNRDPLPPLFGLLRLVHLPQPLLIRGVEIRVPVDPSIIANLLAGNLSRAIATSVRRLTASGLRPYLRTAVGDAALARRYAAALLFPLAPGDAAKLAQRLVKPSVEN